MYLPKPSYTRTGVCGRECRRVEGWLPTPRDGGECLPLCTVSGYSVMKLLVYTRKNFVPLQTPGGRGGGSRSLKGKNG